MSGTSPQCVSRIAKRVPGAAMRMSAPDMIWKPPPSATPWTAAITGIGRLRQPIETCCTKLAPFQGRSVRSRPEPPVAMLPMSSPAQKPRPSPDRTATRTSCIAASSSIAATMPSNIAGSIAFIFSARVRRTSAM